jgi:manganese efflux pump family protein
VIALILAALAVGLDNFGAAVGIGIGGVDTRTRAKLALIFGVFEGGMPLVGIIVGRAVASELGTWDSIAAGVLLGLMGASAIVSSVLERKEGSQKVQPGTWRMLVLGVVLSIDNLVIGFALGANHVNLVAAVVVITVVSTALSLIGLEVGSRMGDKFGESSEILGGLILILLGAAVGTGFI